MKISIRYYVLSIMGILSLYILHTTSYIIPAYAHSEIQVIEMTKDGFSPESVTVDQNQAIIFINKDTQSRWPASNVHPTHDLYPEFDPKKPIEPGQSWSFKPKKIGEHKYHDHLVPHMRGVITVVAEEGKSTEETTFPLVKWEYGLDKIKLILNQALSKFQNLFKADEKAVLPDSTKFITLSYQDQQKILEGVDSQKAWEFIKTTFKGQAGSSGNIHDLAHLSGALLFKDKGFSGLSSCSADLAFGCYHGFLDTAFKENLDHLLDAHQACLQLGSGVSGPVASCIHGIGHGVASFYSTSDLEKSLSTCRKLESGSEYCFDGVFMEYIRSAQSSFFKKDDLLYPCNDLEKKFGYAYSSTCGRNQPSLLMSRFNMRFEEVVQICSNALSKPVKEACLESLGLSLAASADVEQIIKGCQSIPEREYALRCFSAAAGELIFQEVPGWQEKSKQVCNSLGNENKSCYEHINRLIKDYNRQ